MAEVQKATKRERLNYIDRMTPRQLVAATVVGGAALIAGGTIATGAGVGLVSSTAMFIGGSALAAAVTSGLSKIKQLTEQLRENAQLREQVETLLKVSDREAELGQKVNEMTISLANARADISHLVNENRKLTSQNNDLRSENGQLKGQATQYRNEADALEAQLSQGQPSASAKSVKGPRP